MSSLACLLFANLAALSVPNSRPSFRVRLVVPEQALPDLLRVLGRVPLTPSARPDPLRPGKLARVHPRPVPPRQLTVCVRRRRNLARTNLLPTPRLRRAQVGA